MADDDRRDDEFEDEDEELDERDFKSQRDAVLFAINVSDSMLREPVGSDSKKADRDSALAASLKSAYQIMQQRIISDPKDMMGILFFGTEKTKFRDSGDGHTSGLGYPHCYLFMDLDVPAAEDVKALKNLVEDGEDYDEILKPSKEPVAMSNLLFCANQVFTTRAPNFGSRRLFIITDDDSPHGSEKQARSAAAVRAKDLYDLGVVIELFPIGYGDSKFDMAKFYDDIIYQDPAAEANATGLVKASKSGDGLSLLSSLVSNINSKQTPKRSLFSNLPFEIAPGLKISVKGYNILHRQAPVRTCYIWLDGEKAQIAVGETTRMAEDTAKTVEKVEMKKAYKFGGEYVYFTPEEQKALRNFGSPVLRIIGFKPAKLVPVWATVKKSTFVYPSEEDYVGSTRVFSALWKKLLTDKKVGIAWFIGRSNAMPRMVAIIPSPAVDGDSSGAAQLPAGLWLQPLPFADDIRNGPEKPFDLVKAGVESINKMREVVGQLQLPGGTYNPAKYPNPSLQRFYKILQALALEEDVPEAQEDLTQPKFKAIAKRAGPYIQEWHKTIDQTKSLPQHPKREVEDDDDVRPAKKARAAGAGDKAVGGDLAELKSVVSTTGLAKWTVLQLRGVLGSKGLDTSGKKADLVERLEQWVEKQ